VTVPEVVVENAAANDVVLLTLAIVKFTIVVLPFEVIVPVPTKVIVIEVYVPVADNVNEFTLNEVIPGLNAVVPKSRVPNQPPVVIVITDAPLPVNLTLGDRALFACEPPVQVSVLVILASAVKPPVPV
jgi:hypothetical protein